MAKKLVLNEKNEIRLNGFKRLLKELTDKGIPMDIIFEAIDQVKEEKNLAELYEVLCSSVLYTNSRLDIAKFIIIEDIILQNK